MITDETLRELRALCEAATPGPWTAKGYGFGAVGRSVGFCNGFQDDSSEPSLAVGPRNAAFIAASRTFVPALLDEIETLRARVLDEIGTLRGRVAELEAARYSGGPAAPHVSGVHHPECNDDRCSGGC